MLFATYQPHPEVIPERNEEKWAYFRSEFGFEPYWCMPVTSMADFFTHSLFTAPNCGQLLHFIETDDFVRIDKVKHYQKIQHEVTYDLTGCVNPDVDDMHSEFIVPNDSKIIATVPIAGMPSFVANPFFDFAVTKSFGKDLNQMIRKDLQKYLNMGMRCPDMFKSEAEWAASMDMTVPEFRYRMELEKYKMAFETVLLPFVVKQLMGDMISPYDIHAIQHHFDVQRSLYMEFSRWSYDDCSLEKYDRLYTMVRNTVIDNSAVCSVLNNKPGRNDMCPCGSGKKWKKCHGLLV